MLPSERFIYGLLLEVEGRVAIGVAAALAEAADSPYSLIEEVRIEGYHKIRGQNEVFYKLRGPEIRELAGLYGSRFPSSTGALGLTVANHDFCFHLPIIFPPERLPMLVQAAYLLDAPNFDKLQLTVKWGVSGNCCLQPDAATTFTLTAFGVGTGAPRVRVHALYALFGREGPPRGFVPARVWRYYPQENVSATMTATGNEQRIQDISTGQIIRSLLLKTGVKATWANASNAYASLSNAILSHVAVLRGTNNKVVDFADFLSLREADAIFKAIIADAGFGMIDWGNGGDRRQFFDAPGSGVDFFVQGDVLGAANQACLMVIQEIRGQPVGLG